jgi:tryptophan halogenase
MQAPPPTEQQVHIVIVGGGTAGWLTANILNTLLNTPGQERIRITLIESSQIARIGVGEATIPTLTQTLRDIKIPEATFLARTHATFKHAIKFENWSHLPDSGEVTSYYHPFESFHQFAGEGASSIYSPLNHAARLQSIDLSTFWLHRSTDDGRDAFAFETGVQPYLCEGGRAPKRVGTQDYEGDVIYAYHTSADDFGDLLAETGQARLINRLIDQVVSAEVSSDGDIQSVRTQNNGTIRGDFFIDCTGFAALLIEKVLKSPFLSYSDYLLCDRAIALPVPHQRGRLRPYTTSTALDHGWAWQIDLTTRMGAGYVYSSSFIDDDAAEARLRAFIGTQAAEIPARRLRMRIGRRQKFWVRNCVAIGLSAGFLEPLESTGIYLIEAGARLLADFFGGRSTSRAAIDNYNKVLASQFDEIRDFLVLHYCLSKRTDSPFWDEVRKPERVPASLSQKLDLWKNYMPSPVHLPGGNQVFDYRNYQAILFGMGWTLSVPAGRANLRRPTHINEAINAVHASAERALETLPKHEDLLLSYAQASKRTPVRAHRELSLSPGVPLAKLEGLEERIELSNGTIAANKASLDHAYHFGSIVPSGEWRRPTPKELVSLSKAGPLAGPLTFIGVVRPPPDVVKPMFEIVRRFSAETPSGEQIVWDGSSESEMMAASDQLFALYGDKTKTSRKLGLLVNRSGYVTITGDKFDKSRIGLHLDGWSELAPDRRGEAPNRLCINLGTEPRRLLYVNLTIGSIIEWLRSVELDVRGLGATDIGRLFLRTFSNYPVVSIEVRPGEAYVAPTEEIIHDGASDRMTSSDITFTMLGHFYREKCVTYSGVSSSTAIM